MVELYKNTIALTILCAIECEFMVIKQLYTYPIDL
jgi:hypothetical protein